MSITAQPCRILVVAHAPLAQALYACVEHVFPDVSDDLFTADIEPEHDAQLSAECFNALHCWLNASKQPLLILTDIIGATPANAACVIAKKRVQNRLLVRVLTGVNVPMLLRAWTYRQESLDVLFDRAQEGGYAGVQEIFGAN